MLTKDVTINKVELAEEVERWLLSQGECQVVESQGAFIAYKRYGADSGVSVTPMLVLIC